MSGLIVVAVDGSAGAEAAQRWALGHARHIHAALRVVTCFAPPVSEVVAPVGMPVAVVEPGTARAPYRETLDQAVAALRERAEGVSVEGVLAEGPTVDELLAQAKDADLLVVGRTGRNQAVAVLLGSVSRAVLHQAHVPVVVVPAGFEARPLRRIVVGVDGSPGAASALEWAIAEARSWEAALEVVHAWRYPYLGVRTGASELVPLIHADAEHVLAEAVEHARSTGTPTTGHLVEQVESAGVLDVAQAVDADLVVVGSRGRGGFASLVLGSVSTVVATHAACPTVVVRPPA